MQIGVISDTHGNIDIALRIMKNLEKVEFLIHLGDYIEDSKFLRKRFHKKIFSIKGNCDRYSQGEEEAIIPIGSHRIFAVHGHQYGVKTDLTRLYYRGLELGCDIVLFGHTHIPLKEKLEDVFIMNPGSLGNPRGGFQKSYGIITLDNGFVEGNIIYIYS